MALAPAGGDAEVRLPGLSRSVHDAAHHRDLQRDVAVGQGVLSVVGDADHVDLGPAAARAGDEIEALALAQTQGLEQLPPRARFLDRIRGQREADRVADALGEQRPDADGRLDQPARKRARFGHPEGENYADVFTRADKAMAEILERHAGQAVLVVAHHVVNRVYLAPLLGLGIERARELSLDPCAISVIKHGEGKVSVATLNAAFHLQGLAA